MSEMNGVSNMLATWVKFILSRKLKFIQLHLYK